MYSTDLALSEPDHKMPRGEIEAKWTSQFVILERTYLIEWATIGIIFAGKRPIQPLADGSSDTFRRRGPELRRIQWKKDDSSSWRQTIVYSQNQTVAMDMAFSDALTCILSLAKIASSPLIYRNKLLVFDF
jgi:hypothetical protein